MMITYVIFNHHFFSGDTYHLSDCKFVRRYYTLACTSSYCDLGWDKNAMKVVGKEDLLYVFHIPFAYFSEGVNDQ